MGLLAIEAFFLLQRVDDLEVVCLGEAVSLVMLCSCRQPPRRLAVLLLKELKALTLCFTADHVSLIDAMDRY